MKKPQKFLSVLKAIKKKHEDLHENSKKPKWIIDLIKFYKNAKENENEYFKDYLQKHVLTDIKIEENEESYFG